MGRYKAPSILRSALALGFVALFAVCGLARGAVFVYELPDGTRVISDQPPTTKHARVVRVSADVQGAGRLAAQKNSPVFRQPSSTYDRLIRRYSEKYGVDFALVKAIIQAESSFNPYAVSDKGARGLMQMMPATAKQYGVRDIYNPTENIRAGVRHLKYLSDLFDNKYTLVIAAYNAGENAVKQYRGIPPYEETQNYVKRVKQYKRQYTTRHRTYSIAPGLTGK